MERSESANGILLQRHLHHPIQSSEEPRSIDDMFGFVQVRHCSCYQDLFDIGRLHVVSFLPLFDRFLFLFQVHHEW